MNKQTTPSEFTEPPVWFITGGSSGTQPGDPVRAVKAIIGAVVSGRPPHHLLLGKDAFEGAMAKVDELRRGFTAGEVVARGADFPSAVA